MTSQGNYSAPTAEPIKRRQLWDLAAAILRPSPKLPPDEWARANRVYPETSGLPGPRDPSLTPYVIPVVRAVHAGLHKRVVLVCGAQMGKSLALDTPLPTPRGWTTMADVRVGDTYEVDEEGDRKDRPPSPGEAEGEANETAREETGDILCEREFHAGALPAGAQPALSARWEGRPVARPRCRPQVDPPYDASGNFFHQYYWCRFPIQLL